jgi:hypothetical protein
MPPPSISTVDFCLANKSAAICAPFFLLSSFPTKVKGRIYLLQFNWRQWLRDRGRDLSNQRRGARWWFCGRSQDFDSIWAVLCEPKEKRQEKCLRVVSCGHLFF